MRIALATCASLPAWEVDDRPLFAVLQARGAHTVAAVWDDPRIDWSAFDAILIRTTWDYMDKHGAFVAWARRAAAVTRLFNPPDVVEWNTRKTYLRDLEARGVPIAPTIWLSRGQRVDIAAVMHERRWARGFLKPVIGATARETLRFDGTDSGHLSAQQHVDRLLACEDMMLQPYLGRVESEGERSVVFIDGRVSHAVQKVPVAGDYRVQDDFGAADFAITADAALITQAQIALAAAEAHLGSSLLYARCDFLTDDAGSHVLTEFEAVEPSLFFRHSPAAAERLADALIGRLHRDLPAAS